MCYKHTDRQDRQTHRTTYIQFLRNWKSCIISFNFIFTPIWQNLISLLTIQPVPMWWLSCHHFPVILVTPYCWLIIWRTKGHLIIISNYSGYFFEWRFNHWCDLLCQTMEILAANMQNVYNVYHFQFWSFMPLSPFRRNFD